MEKIGDLFQRNIRRKIEEVIKVDQTDESVVHDELTEYVATDSIRDHFRNVLRAYSEAPSAPTEGIGVWVSGFFGSGKSSFAKILGYVVEDRTVLEEGAVDVFCRQVHDENIAALLDFTRKSIPTQSVIFDVSTERGLRTASERIDAVMYKALLRQLGYCVDFELAELEIALEGDGRLGDFIATYGTIYSEEHGEEHGSWRYRRNLGAVVYNEASRALHELDPDTYPEADSWARGKQPFDLDARKLAERSFELMARRRPDTALLFVVDEVGQYVSRSVDKMLALQAVIQAFGVVGRNRVAARQAIAPAWIIVTSQEKLDEVVDALDSKKIELARLQDRFPVRIDLAPADIAEVTSRRILAKRPEAEEHLQKLYDENVGRLNANCRLEGASYRVEVDREAFVRLYPYLPYHIELCIDIMSGIRMQPGAQRHIGGSNRTIIKQAQQLLIHPRVNLADKPVGHLVTFDMVYDLVEGNLSSERKTDMTTIANRFSEEPVVVKVAKAVCVLEFSQKVPRTPANIAAVLCPRIDADSVLGEVKKGLEELEKAQFVKQTEGGYKLQTEQEKGWDTKRRSLEPKQAQRNEIRRAIVEEIFGDPKLRTYKYRNLRTFKLGVTLDDVPVGGEGSITFCLRLADDEEEAREVAEECRRLSREEDTPHWHEVFWVVTQTDEIHRATDEYFRSAQMVSTHERLAAQGKLSAELSACLADEKRRRDTLGRELRTHMLQAAAAGQFLFRGVQEDASAHGGSAPEIVKSFLDKHILDLFEKLELGARPVGADEPAKVLTASNLSGLLAIFYDPPEGLSLVTKEGGRYVPNPEAEIAQEILSYIKRMSDFGEKVTGKSLEKHFGGFGYGWERDMLRLVLAVLLRAGTIEVTYQGRRFRDHNDPMVRQPFTSNNAFRAAAFAAREAPDLKTLTNAARNYEDITGEEVEIEESAIAQAFQAVARDDRETVLPLSARVSALGFPGGDFLQEHLNTLEGIVQSAADDCVRTLANEGQSFKAARQRVSKMSEALTESGIAAIQAARFTVQQKVPVLAERWTDDEPLRQAAEELSASLEAETFYERMTDIAQNSTRLQTAYAELYGSAHEERAEVCDAAIEAIKGIPDWPTVPEETQKAILAPLASRCCKELALPATGSAVCQNCRASVGQMESDVAAADGLRRAAVQAVDEALAEPEERLERLRVADFFPESLSSPEDVEASIDKLREHLLKLLAEGARVMLE